MRTSTADTGSSRVNDTMASLLSWFWDVERDLVWTGAGMPGIELRNHPWLGSRDPADAVSMQTWLDQITDGDGEQALGLLEQVRVAPVGTELRSVVRAVVSDRWFGVRASVAEAANGLATYVYGLAFDITAVREAEAELRLREEILEQIGTAEPLAEVLDRISLALGERLPAPVVGILIHDRDSGRLWPASAPGADEEIRTSVVGLPVSDGVSAAGSAAARGEDVFVPDIALHPYTEDHRAGLIAKGMLAAWAHPLISANGRVLGVIALYRSVVGLPTPEERELLHRYGRLATLAIERASLNQELQRSASVDYYTGLPNRASFLELVNGLLADDDEISVIVVDVDGDDRAVTGRPHVHAQAILADIATRMTDLVGDDGIVACLGTAEFAIAVVMPPDDAETLSERLLRAFDRPFEVGQAAFYLNPSIGISHAGNAVDSEVDSYGLVRDASTALARARMGGRGRRRVYDASLHGRVMDRVELEADLRRGLEAGEFFLVYQPMLNVEDDVYDRVEALIRWQHPTRGLVPPDEFIPLAEESGLIIPLGDMVFRLAIEQAHSWHERFPEMRIAVNVSSIQLANPTFAAEIVALMLDSGVPATTFAIEITESGLMESLEVSRASLERLIEIGVRVSVDDFGTGHSSLARLDEVPISGLKIDKRFIQRLTTDSVAPKVVRAIVDVARAHGLFIVAEGVEDEATFAMVQELGCQRVQGYYLSRPLDPAAAEEFLVNAQTLG